jgi:hypothetical protein
VLGIKAIVAAALLCYQPTHTVQKIKSSNNPLLLLCGLASWGAWLGDFLYFFA